jgi:hypothetical protein
MPVDLTSLQAYIFICNLIMIKFKASELTERNYKDGDTVYLSFIIKSVKMSDGEIWLHSIDNNNNVWLKQEDFIHGEPYNYRDGEIVTYNGSPGKIVKGFNDDWYILTSNGAVFDLNPALINTVNTENNVL